MKINKFTSIVASLMLAGAFTSVSACEAPVDVHPLSCPNPINANANRHALMPAAILGGAVFGMNYLAYGVEAGDPIYMSDIDLDEPIYLYIQTLGNPGDPAPLYKSAVAVKYALEDVAAPATDNPNYEQGQCGKDENNCYSEEDGNGPDGEEDLVLKFKTHDVIRAIEVSTGEFVKDGETYCVTIQAKHKSGLNIHGTDTIRINKRKEK